MMSHVHAFPISDEAVETFQQQGFLKLKQLLTKEEISRLRRALREALGTFGNSPNSYDVTAAADAFWNEEPILNDVTSIQHDLCALAAVVRNAHAIRLLDAPADGERGHFLLDTSVWRRVADLEHIVLRSVVPKVACELLGCDPVRYYDDQLFVKEPGAVDRTAFHQDFPYFHLDRPEGCAFWIPLTSVRAGGGRMGYVPGSHRWGETFKPNIFVSALPFPGSEEAEMPDIENAPEQFNVQYVEAEPGDVIVHHFLTVHGSEGNRTGNTRSAFSLRYCDPAARYRRRNGAPAQPLHRHDMRDGDPLDDTIHPKVWCRTDPPQVT